MICTSRGSRGCFLCPESKGARELLLVVTISSVPLVLIYCFGRLISVIIDFRAELKAGYM